METLQMNSAPASVQMCRICLHTGCNLYSMIIYKNLYQAYEMLTGLMLENDEDIPQCLCSECAQRLLNCAHFRTRSLRAHLILLEVVKKYDRITPESVMSTMGNENFLLSNLAVKHNKADHYDLEIQHIEKDNENSNLSSSNTYLSNVGDYIKIESNENYDVYTIKDDTEYIPNVIKSNHDNIKLELDGTDHNSEEDKTINTKIALQLQEPVVIDAVKLEDVFSDQIEDFNFVCVDPKQKDNSVAQVNMNDVTETISNTFRNEYDDIKTEEAEEIYRNNNGDAIDEACLTKLHEGVSEIKGVKDVGSTKLNKTSYIAADSNMKQGKKYTSRVDRSSAAGRRAAATRNQKFSCQICNYQSVQGSQFLSHLKTHTDSKTFDCHVCNYKGTKIYRLIKHLKTHVNDKLYSCAHCAKMFRVKGALQRHLRTHSGEKPYSCNVCEKKFSESGTLRTHLRIHTGEKPYSCNECSKQFSDRSTLRRHIKIHIGIKRHVCDICNKTFYDLDSLKNHSGVHKDERKYSCDICTKSFKNKHAVKSHLKTHSVVPRHQKQDLKKFACEQCGKKFSQKSLLQNHVGTHDNEKPYTCQVCSKSFGYKVGLQKHLKIHSTREKYSCDMCHKVFIEKNYLHKHIRFHCRVKLNI